MKKFFIFFLFAVAIGINCSSQTVFNIKKMGAKGNGRTDDTKAIIQAVAKINAMGGNAVLYIPKGTYVVQPQKSNLSGTPPYLPVTIFDFKNCSNVTVKGDKGTIIKFASSLYYGSFQKTARGMERVSKVTTDYNLRVAVGNGISLTNCSNITVTNIEINGNSSGFITGGQFGDVGFQIDNDGIFIQDSKNISLKNLNIHHFGRDGIQVINKTPLGFLTPSQQLVISDCKFDYNGRQGFSWTGGVGLKVSNSSFSNTGKGKFTSPPGAGVDFEPNGGYVVKDGAFTNCCFQNNSGVAVLADEGGKNVQNIQFENCVLSGDNAAACWIKSPQFTFTSCIINGTFFFGYAADNIGDGTKFIRCKFSDSNMKDSPLNYLVESNGAKYLLFDHCDFEAHWKGIMFMASSGTSPASRTQFRSCNFRIDYSAAKPVALAYSSGADFLGKCTFSNTSKQNVGWNFENSGVAGLTDETNNFEIGSRFQFASYNTVLIGNGGEVANVTISDNGTLQMNNNSKLEIGKHASLTVKKGGALWIAPGAELTIAGKLIVEEGAYLCIHNQAKLSEQSRKNIILNGKPFFTDNPQMKYGYSGCIIIGQ